LILDGDPKEVLGHSHLSRVSPKLHDHGYLNFTLQNIKEQKLFCKEINLVPNLRTSLQTPNDYSPNE
jgi:hypothetical protein